MLRFSLGLLGGTWLLQQFSILPAPGWLILAVSLAIIAAWRRAPSWLLGLLLGFAWAAASAWWRVPEPIPELQPRQTYLASGVIDRLPQVGDGRARLRLRVRELSRDGGTATGDWPLRVSWHEAPPLRVGQHWKLPLRIRPVHGYRNPGGWDYAGWLFRQGVRYTAYVADGEARLLGSESCCHVDRLRQWLLERLRPHLDDGVGEGMLLALTLGERSGLDRHARQVLASTGTSHLFAISGLHIGLAAGAFGFCLAWLWRRLSSLCTRVPALVAGALGGLALACVYALVSGFDLPAQRALVMLAAGTWVLLMRDRVAPFELWGAALVAVLAFDPAASQQAGFWLSFCAVAAILALLPHLRGRHPFVQALWLQTGIALALYPVLLAFGMQGSLVGPLVNLVLVPLFGVLIVPISLLTVVLTLLLPDLGVTLGWMAQALAAIHQVLAWLAEQVVWPLHTPWALSSWLVLVAGTGLLLLPPGMPFRMLGLALVLAPNLPPSPRLAAGSFSLTLLDVGQGLSVVIRTRQRVLLYDTGARYRSGFDLADAVLLPYLRHQGIGHIDTLVLSHGDNDHAGAARRLLEQIPSDEVFSGEPWRTKVTDRLCRAGQTWTWDGVQFTFVQPRKAAGQKGNNASCVLLIEGAGGRALIPGDIEARIEKMLLGVLPTVDLLVAPHHGSLSSSIQEFVDALVPDHVLFAVGALNRYGFPRENIVLRWQRAGARAWRTDHDGAIDFTVDARHGMIGPDLYHWRTRRYWHQFPAESRP